MPESDTVRVKISPEDAERAEREARRGYRFRESIVAVMGFFGALGGLAFFLDPSSVDESAIGRNLSGPWDELWSAAWLVGGTMIMFGVLRVSKLTELLGWCVFVPAVVMYAVAVVLLTGTPPGLFSLLGLGVGGGARIAYWVLYAPKEMRVRVERRREPPEPFGGPERREGEG